ncbi:MAG: type I phosphomannose isomerase catalytic subunit, partial [Clostridia bacterium]
MIYKLNPTLATYLWGGRKLITEYNKQSTAQIVAESWEMSVHKDGLSAINVDGIDTTLLSFVNTYPQLLGESASINLMIKLIDAKRNLSVQVHPNDLQASIYGDNGKTEMWYILNAEPQSLLYFGFNRAVSKEQFATLIERGEVESVLNSVPVSKGDCFLIEAGTLHAIGAGISLLEVQESSNLTYRVYDYNRVDSDGKKRELHIDKALDVIDFDKINCKKCNTRSVKRANATYTQLVDCAYFISTEIS